MKSRRDQVHAQAYVVGRLTSALVHAEPDAPESPMRRTTLGSFGGLMIGALLVAGFLVWGLISPASKATALTAGEFVMVNETGARYIYVGRQLRPVLNWSSALLLLGGNPKLTSVSAASLAGVPQGQPLGIVGAPDALPAAGAVNRADWLVCAQAGASNSAVSLSIGPWPAGRPQQPAGAAVIVQDSGGTQYLIWHADRLRLDAPWIRDALGLGSAPVIQVSLAWLNAVPAGRDLQAIPVPGRGGAGPVLGGQRTRVGQILVARNVGSPSEFYLAEAAGIAPVTPAQAALLLTDPATAAAYPGVTPAPVPVSPAAIASTPATGRVAADGAGSPPAPPSDFAPAGGGVPCMDYPGAGGAGPSLVFATPPAGAPPALGMPGVSASPEVAGQITVAPDAGALVRPQAAPGVGGNALFLVTDAGVKYPVPSSAAALALGYRAGQAAALPAALLGLLPTGPALDLPALGG